MTTATACLTCGGEVTSKDPTRYPYCRTCHYTGVAQEHFRRGTVEAIGAAFPEASWHGIEHTGGGCFRLAVYFDRDGDGEPDECYCLTDGEAGLPSDPETEDPIEGGWGYVGWEDNREETWGYEESWRSVWIAPTALASDPDEPSIWSDPERFGIPTAEAIRLIRADLERFPTIEARRAEALRIAEEARR